MDGKHRKPHGPAMGSACAPWRRAITLFLDGELSGEARAGLEQHLRTCRQCRGEIELRRVMRSEWAGAMSIASTPHDRAAVVDAAREHMREVRSRRRRRSSWWGVRRRGDGRGVRWRVVGDFVTTAAVVASVLLAGQIVRWRGAAGSLSKWASSSSVGVYDPGGYKDKASETRSVIPRPF